MNWKEKIAKAFYGADWEIKFRKMEIRNSNIYINENKRMIRRLKAKLPYRKWLGEARPYKREVEFYEGQKKDSENKLKKWMRIRALMKSKKLKKVM